MQATNSNDGRTGQIPDWIFVLFHEIDGSVPSVVGNENRLEGDEDGEKSPPRGEETCRLRRCGSTPLGEIAKHATTNPTRASTLARPSVPERDCQNANRASQQGQDVRAAIATSFTLHVERRWSSAVNSQKQPRQTRGRSLDHPVAASTRNPHSRRMRGGNRHTIRRPEEAGRQARLPRECKRRRKTAQDPSVMTSAELCRRAAISPGVRRIPTLIVFPTTTATPKPTPRMRSRCPSGVEKSLAV